MTGALALPDPQTLAAGQVPMLVERIIDLRSDLRERKDIAGAEDLRRRLAAYERYVADKRARRALEAESRRTEALIGELLGPPPGRGANQGDAFSGREKVHPQHHADFWMIAEYPIIREIEIAEGRTARAKIITAIERHKLASNTPSGESAIRAGDFRQALADLPDESVDLIFTDPPYAREHIDDYADLAALGARVLKPGASLLAYCGQYALPDILAGMSGHLRYWWLCACVHVGDNGTFGHAGRHKSLPGIKTYVLWKPIVWFVKDTNGSNEFVFDAILRPAPSKVAHDWQQGLEEPLHYIEHLCPPDGLVVDPFTGGGTTAVAARQLGRRFIGSEISDQHRAIAEGRLAA